MSRKMSFFDIQRQPDYVAVATETGSGPLDLSGETWAGYGTAVTCTLNAGRMTVALAAPDEAVTRVHLRWRGDIPVGVRILGDHWERGYGDLEWRGIVPERPLPWYFLFFDGISTHGYGVETGGSAIAFWQVDASGVSLTLDVRNGSMGVLLGERILTVADIVSYRGLAEESPFASATALCKALCSAPRRPSHPVYGGNDWYYAYGRNTRDGILGDAERMASLAPDSENRPYMVIDGGWSPNESESGPWNVGNERFPDMPGLAKSIAAMGVRPGIWFRPLTSTSDTESSLLFPHRPIGPPIVLDPTIPESLQKIAEDVQRFREWGYELIKHDFSTFDIFGKWGFQGRNGADRQSPQAPFQPWYGRPRP